MSAEKMDMDNLVRIGKDTMNQVAREGDDYLPKLLVGYASGHTQLFGLAIDMNELMSVLPEIMGEKIDWVAFTVDSYYVSVVTGEDGPEPGHLGEAFDAGDTRVSEALSISLVGEDHADFVMVPYRRIGPQKRVLSWREPITQSLDVQGRVVDALRYAVTMSGRVS
jgi:hypothetical protein